MPLATALRAASCATIVAAKAVRRNPWAPGLASRNQASIRATAGIGNRHLRVVERGTDERDPGRNRTARTGGTLRGGIAFRRGGGGNGSGRCLLHGPGLAELALVGREALWQLQAIVHAVQRRWL